MNLGETRLNLTKPPSRLGMVNIPPVYGDFGDGLLLFYTHYLSLSWYLNFKTNVERNMTDDIWIHLDTSG